tara:strand:- start:4120 stop:4272 length:153 start_codon:yes stop_codon:yes gene_type:complete
METQEQLQIIKLQEEINFLKNDIRDLQTQLQNSYMRIKELNETENQFLQE